MGHNHNHDCSQENLKLVFLLNLGFTLVEFVGGWLTNSTAIMADALHDLGDTLAIGLSWLLSTAGLKAANSRFTYGYQRLSLLGALINAAILIAGSFLILVASASRLANPEMPVALGMFWIAIFGIVVNALCASRLSGGRTQNEKVLSWHLFEDLLGWVAVLLVSTVLLFFEVPILDPLLSIAITLFILYNVIKGLFTTSKIFLQGNPDEKMCDEIQQVLLSIDHVEEIHHLHFWSLDGDKNVLTAHILLDIPISAEIHSVVKQSINTALERYHLAHTTIEFEQLTEVCRDN